MMSLQEYFLSRHIQVDPLAYARYAIVYNVAEDESQSHTETAVEQFLKARGYTHNGSWEKEATLEDVREDIKELRKIKPAGAALKNVKIMHTPFHMCHIFLPADDI